MSALLLGVLLYGVFIVYTGLDQMGDSLHGFAWSAMAFAVLLATFNYFLRFLRWQYYLKLLNVRGVSAPRPPVSDHAPVVVDLEAPRGHLMR